MSCPEYDWLLERFTELYRLVNQALGDLEKAVDLEEEAIQEAVEAQRALLCRINEAIEEAGDAQALLNIAIDRGEEIGDLEEPGATHEAFTSTTWPRYKLLLAEFAARVALLYPETFPDACEIFEVACLS
jgi:hypothetical protein